VSSLVRQSLLATATVAKKSVKSVVKFRVLRELRGETPKKQSKPIPNPSKPIFSHPNPSFWANFKDFRQFQKNFFMQSKPNLL
jgi:hypothetical protein